MMFGLLRYNLLEYHIRHSILNDLILGAILTKINDIFVNCLSAEAVKCIPKAESEIDFMFAYEHMRIGV